MAALIIRAVLLACVVVPLFGNALQSRTAFNSGGLNYSSAVWIGSSICRGERPGVTFGEAVPNLVGVSKRFVPSRNMCVGGDTSTGMLARFQADVLAYGPAMVAIEPCYNDTFNGINVATCEANTTAMVNMAKRAGARVTLWIIPFSCDADVVNTPHQPYITALRALAVSLSVDVFDTYDDFVALPGATQTSYFMPADCQHFSPAGLAWMAGLVGTGAYANSFLAATAP